MKILIFSQYFAPENFRINELVLGLQERGHDITVITGQPNYPTGNFYPGYGRNGPKYERIYGAHIFRVPVVPRRNGSAIDLTLNFLSYALFASIAVIFKLRSEYDIIFVFQVSPVTVCLPALIASKRFNLSVIMWVLDAWPDSLKATGALKSPILLNLISIIVRQIYAGCSKILVQSKALVPSINEMNVPLSNIYYFPNWIEEDYKSISAVMPNASTADESFRIVYAGNIGVAQDFPSIIDAAEHIAAINKNIKFIIAGDGRMLNWVKNEVHQRKLDFIFEFLGQLPSTHMHDLFSSADVLLLALRNDPILAATIPGKLQSYMASSRPVIGMVNGEASRIIRESGCGIAVSSGDSTALVTAILSIIALPQHERILMAQRGQVYANNEFDRNTLFDQLETWLLEEVAANRILGARN